MKRKIILTAILLLLGFPLLTYAKSLMYVVTGPSNKMLIIDTQTDEIIGEIGELENAHGLAGNSNTDYLVAGSMQQSGQQSGASKPSSMSEEEHKAHHQADNSSATMGNSKSYVSIVHPAHGHVMQRIQVVGITHHTSVSPDGKTAAAVHSKNGGVSVIDLDSFEVKKFIKTGQVPNYAVFNKLGNKLYVSNAGAGNISVIDTKSLKVTKTIKVGAGPEHMTIDNNHNRLAVLNVISGNISIVDLDNNKVIKNIKVGKSPHGTAFDKTGSWLYVTNKGSDTLSKVNIDSEKVKTVVLSPAPYHLELDNEQHKLYISSRKKPAIWVVDEKSLTIKNTINIPSGVAHQMVFINRN